MAEKTVAAPAETRPRAEREVTRAAGRHIRPPVDIYETKDTLMLMADLPGVSKDGLEVRVSDNVLTIEGRPAHVAPGKIVYREYDLANFFRQFELSEEIDQEKIRADLKDGVLALHLPKTEKAKPRQVQVKVT